MLLINGHWKRRSATRTTLAAVNECLSSAQSDTNTKRICWWRRPTEQRPTFRPPDVWDFVMILAARAGRLRSVQSSLRVREDGENQTLRALSRQFFLIPSEPPGTR
jgi:hypothetical protein